MTEAHTDHLTYLASELKQKLGAKRRLLTIEDQVATERGKRTHAEILRSPTNRLMRGSLAAAFWEMRENPAMFEPLLKEFRLSLRDVAHKLDRLDNQVAENIEQNTIFVNLPSGEKQRMWVAEFDLARPKEGEPDYRIPWIMIGGAGATGEFNTPLSSALALNGEKVYVLPFPEEMRGQDKLRGRLEPFQNMERYDLLVFTETVRHIIQRCSQANFIGHSLGAAMLLEVAKDPDFKGKIQDVVALSPTGFTRRSLFGIGRDFLLEGRAIQKDPEGNVMLKQGVQDAHFPHGIHLFPDFWGLGRASGTKFFIPGDILRILGNITGSLEVWVGEHDKVVSPNTIGSIIEKAVTMLPHDQKNRVASYIIQAGGGPYGARHDAPLTGAYGLVQVREAEKKAREGIRGPYLNKRISEEALERNAAEWILSRITAQSHTSNIDNNK